MILSLALFLQVIAVDPSVVATPVPTAESRFDACALLAAQEPEKAIEQANQWRIQGGGVPARHCLALAYARLQRWPSAAVAFEQAARESELAQDGRAANLWVQGGNARLAAGEYPAARAALDTALASGALKAEMAGEAHLDRARASVGMNDPAAARRDLDQALKLVPDDPLAWLLSATLARRMQDVERAQADIAEAAKRSPDDASVALEAGNIAILAGSPEAARVAWQGAVDNQPDSPAGKAAAAALKAMDAPKTEPQPRQ